MIKIDLSTINEIKYTNIINLQLHQKGIFQDPIKQKALCLMKIQSKSNKELSQIKILK